MNAIKWIIGVPVIGLCLMMLLGALISANEAASYAPLSEREKFDNAALGCWENYARKSHTPEEKVNIAAFCEGLEKRAKDAR
jgi:hypothetical protein